MKLIYAQGFSKSEKEEWRSIIFSNLNNAFKVIIDAMEELDISLGRRENEVGSSRPIRFRRSPLTGICRFDRIRTRNRP
jgi:hypothetical protein